MKLKLCQALVSWIINPHELMIQATTACKETWSVALHLFEAARKGVMAKMSEILGYGWGILG